MKSHFSHIQVNIDFANMAFYKDLMTLLGWSVIFEMDGIAGYKSGKDGDIWFLQAKTGEQGNYDNVGVNHIGIRVEKQKDVNAVVKFLKEKDISPLFETPKHRPDFSSKETETYYQVMFESPDKVLFEIFYTGPKE